MRERSARCFPIALLFLASLCAASLLVGAATLPWSEIRTWDDNAWLTLTASRLPRLMALLLTGAGLSICGVILQQIVRNRFVEPATSGGLDAAKLGMLVALTSAPQLGAPGRMLLGLAFCFVSNLLYIAIIRRIPVRNVVLLPVIGLMYGGVLSSIAEFHAYRNNILQSMQAWMLGDASNAMQGSYEILYLILPTVALAYRFAQRFTLLGLHEDMAKGLGVNVALVSAGGLLLVAMTVSTTVLVIGAAPFVGLVIPNLVSMYMGDNLTRTLPVIALCGAALLLACDILGRLLIHPFEVPVGLTVGCVGGMLFLFIMFSRAR